MGIIYAIFDSLEYMKTSTLSVRYFLLRVLSGHYHLWFLPTILGVYICLPIIKLLVDQLKKEQIIYLYGIILIAVIGKSTLDPVLQELFNTAVWDGFWDNFALSDLSVGILYFMTGYFLDQYKDAVSRKKCLLLWMISVISGALVNMFFAFYLHADVEFTHGLLSIWIFGSSTALFLYLLKSFEQYIPEEKTANLIKELSSCTFGIYLIHAVIIEHVCLKIGLQTGKLSYIVNIGLFSVIVFICSFFVTFILKKIKIKKMQKVVDN